MHIGRERRWEVIEAAFGGPVAFGPWRERHARVIRVLVTARPPRGWRWGVGVRSCCATDHASAWSVLRRWVLYGKGTDRTERLSVARRVFKK